MAIITTFPWKRNESIQNRQNQSTRHVLSSSFLDNDSEEYVTSDYYGEVIDIGEERDDISTPRENTDESDREPDSPTMTVQSLSTISTLSSSPAMDFVPFDGVWNDPINDNKEIDYNLPWHFIEFGFEETSKVQEKSSSSRMQLLKLKENKVKLSSTPKSKLFRVFDTEVQTSGTFPLQNITNVQSRSSVNSNQKVKGNMKVQQVVKTSTQRPKLQQINTKFNLKPKPAPQQKSIDLNWLTRSAPSKVSTASTGTQSLSPVCSEEDEFWEEIVSQCNEYKTIPKIAYSIRSVVSDGSKSQSESKDRVLLPNNIHLRTSYWTEMNQRAYMEDRVTMDYLGNVPLPTYGLDMALILKKLRALKSNSPDKSITDVACIDPRSCPDLPMSLFATFDGHAGHLCSQYCSDWISYFLQKQASYPRDLPLALRTAFHNIDQDFMKSGNTDGSTACVCCVIGRKRVICANAGDSRAIIVKRDGNFISLSRDHKPQSPRETKRINDLGGHVVYSGRWRVEGRLAVSRSIGDSTLKKYVTADPDVFEYDLQPDDCFVVIASDGIWDVLENHQVATMTLSYSCKVMNPSRIVTEDNLKWTAKKICDRAKELGSRDNLSTLVIDLLEPGH